MTGPLRSVSWSVLALALLVAGALGAASALALSPQPVPPSLTTSEPLGDVSVSTRTFDDSRTVELALETGAERQISTPRAGTITANDCSPAGTITSGTRLAAVDGQPIIGLATSEPLWRDLRDDDEGADVRALQTELARLGEPVRADGIVGAETLRAVSRLLRAEPELDVIPVDAFAWLPAASVSTPACPAVVGSTIEVGEPLATLPVALAGARIATTPVDLLDGKRTLTVGEIEAAVSRDGAISDPQALEALAVSPDYAAATGSDGSPTLTATYALTKPLEVVVVPPTALYGMRGSVGCVADGDRSVRVRVVGSELGESFVVPSQGAKLSRVSLTTTPPMCR